MSGFPRLSFVCVLLLSVFALASCSVGPSTHFTVTDAELRSQDSTVQAQAALESFFNALESGDDDSARTFVTPAHRDIDWNVRRIVVETITAEAPDSWVPDGVYTEADVRVFRAPVRMWPGDGSYQAGERLDWVWILQRGSDGRWRVRDWGFV